MKDETDSSNFDDRAQYEALQESRLNEGGAMGTKQEPGKYDCYDKALPEEPTFTLLGRDPAAALTVRYWISLRRFLSDPDEDQLTEAEVLCQKLEAWAESHGKTLTVVRLRKAVQSG